MTASQSVEEFVARIVKNLYDLNFNKIDETLEILQRMKKSQKEKHVVNYWKVVQCLGEAAIDMFARLLDNITKTSCSGHMYSNMNQILRLLEHCLSSMAVIRRALAYKEDLLAALFNGIRQNEDEELVMTCFRILYKLLLAGKDYCAAFVKIGILKDCNSHIKCRKGLYGIYPLLTVLYCTKILWVISEFGEQGTKGMIIKSKAYKELCSYVENVHSPVKGTECLVSEMHIIIARIKKCPKERTASGTTRTWVPKVLLYEDIGQKDHAYIFCSSPSCRKQQADGKKILYCGDCRLARYCNEECQKEHWRSDHREKCLKRIRKEKKT
ncbi:hypothetical protein FSP39_023140 [Pinctada imbricata]|uniref:MYND-type domain-containing protein n=1 Tax=Pinctada imbricata TaxID=66713 RepID=A0AA88XT44_PINIB|nr:hypothetical protein FSP39_023140 [Pinctada imbricata]